METLQTLEWRRKRAWELYQQGWTQKAIREAWGVTSGAVSQWITAAKAGGVEALAAKPRPGVPSKLTPAQKQALVPLLTQGAEAHGYAGDVWTLARVAHVVEQHFGVHYHPSTMSDLLRELGWTWQQPRTRASQRDEEAITVWQQDTWPILKKKPKPRSRSSCG